MKTFEFYYCYGGMYRGADRYRRTIEAETEDEAKKEFNRLYYYEDIYTIREMTSPSENSVL